MTGGIYGVLHRPTNRWYVGRAWHFASRWRLHRYVARHGSGVKFHVALREHPMCEFTWMVLQLCSTKESFALEEQWIARLRAFEDGFNCTEGGDATPGDYAGMRAKMSAKGRARVDRPFLGRKHSPESLRLINAAAARRGLEWRTKLAAKARGRRASESARFAMSIAAKRSVATRQRDRSGKFVAKRTA